VRDLDIAILTSAQQFRTAQEVAAFLLGAVQMLNSEKVAAVLVNIPQ
jgi:hypothetical protein